MWEWKSYNAELYHFGIKGMHWGERRYQNEDGSYTSAGKARYGIGEAVSKAKGLVGNVTAKFKQEAKTAKVGLNILRKNGHYNRHGTLKNTKWERDDKDSAFGRRTGSIGRLKDKDSVDAVQRYAKTLRKQMNLGKETWSGEGYSNIHNARRLALKTLSSNAEYTFSNMDRDWTDHWRSRIESLLK